MYRLAVLNSHPIQYFAPFYRRVSKEKNIDLTVFYCDEWGTTGSDDPEFGQTIAWDIPLLEGYKYKFLPNFNKNGGIHSGFWGLQNYSIINEIRHGQFDAILVHGYAYMTNLTAIITARLFGIPVFIRGDTQLSLKYNSYWQRIRKLLIKQIFKLGSAFLAIGSKNQKYYEAFGIDPQKIFRVPFAVDNTFFSQRTDQLRGEAAELRKKLNINPGLPVVLFASKFIGRKRPLDMLKAFHTNDLMAKAALVYVGSGPEETTLRSYVDQHGLQNIHFLGFQNQSQLPKYFALADVFVLPSENEPWGLVVNEAMCARLPVILAEEIGAAEDLLFHGENGFKYRAGDISALGNYLRYLIENPERRRQMGHRSYEIIQAWSFEDGIAGLQDALKSV